VALLPGWPSPPHPVLHPDTAFSRIPLKPHELMAAVTPVEGLFVLAHLGIPHVDPDTLTLTIDGLVRHPTPLALNDLMQRRKHIVEAVHACVGSPLAPDVPQRRVVNVVWGAVALDELLDELGILPETAFIWSYGLDHGDFYGTTSDAYLKDLPLGRVAAGDVLLARR